MVMKVDKINTFIKGTGEAGNAEDKGNAFQGKTRLKKSESECLGTSISAVTSLLSRQHSEFIRPGGK